MAMMCDWKWNGVFFFYSRDPSFMSLIDSPLFVKFSELYANDFFIIFVFGRITAKLLLDTDLRFLV